MNSLKAVYTRNIISPVYVLLWPLLLILSFLYFLSINLIRLFYQIKILKSYKPRAKTISVGNITLGGSGKTPIAEYLALLLSPRKRRPAILLRGYKKPKNIKGLGLPDYYLMGDEACMLKQNLKNSAGVFSSDDRLSEAESIDEEAFFDTIILDDGFQHWRIKRDLDIVAIDAVNPFGNGLILPLGPLRETLGALNRADIFCLTRCDEAKTETLKILESKLKKINPKAAIIKSIHAPEYFYDALTGEKLDLREVYAKKVVLIAGLANPFSFSSAMKKLDAEIASEIFFDDHHEFSSKEICDVLAKAERLKADFVVTTQKDIVRWQNWFIDNKPKVVVIVLKIALKVISGENSLDERLHSLYNT